MTGRMGRDASGVLASCEQSTITAYIDGQHLERREAPTRKSERTEPPERLERLASRCSAIEPDGTQCRVFSLHPECWKHRRQPRPRDE